MIIPRSNMHNLMLRADVVKAVEKGEFHIWAIDHVTEAIEIFTGKWLASQLMMAATRWTPYLVLLKPNSTHYVNKPPLSLPIV